MTGSGILMEWLGIGPLSWTVLRVVLIWTAFHGAGRLLLKTRLLRERFSLLPGMVAGLIAYIVLAIVLSLFHVLTRTVLALSLGLGSIAGFLFIVRDLRRVSRGPHLPRSGLLMAFPVLLTVYLVLSGLMTAGRPELDFNDTQVTYLVQPDRWLSEGRMYFLDETKFSAFPMIAETLLLYPCSLSEDRYDQIVMGQVFCFSMLLVMLFLTMRILRFGPSWWPAAWIGVLGCPLVLLWGHFAKPDPAALLFVTLSLSLKLRQVTDRDHETDLSAYLLMGMALATKYTAYPALIPLAVMHFQVRKGWREHVRAMLVLAAVPAAYAVRTFLHTGTPFYPFNPSWLPGAGRWRMPEVELTYSMFNDRSSHFFPHVGFLRNIMDYFVQWGSSIIVLILGYVATLRKSSHGLRAGVLSGVLLYAAVSLILFDPAWWGAKYGMLLIPFSLVFGLYMFRKLRYGLAAATAAIIITYFLFDTSLSPTEHYGQHYRIGIIASFFEGEWKVEDYPPLDDQDELKLTLWMNRHLPPGSTILSFYVTKRYFSDHRWMVAWRYPPAAGIYLENSLSEEMGILDRLGVDYIFTRYGVPAPFDDERSVELFSRIGPGDILEPVLVLDDHVLLEYNREAM